MTEPPDLARPVMRAAARLHRNRAAGQFGKEAEKLDVIGPAIAEILDRFTPVECANYIANAGYQSA